MYLLFLAFERDFNWQAFGNRLQIKCNVFWVVSRSKNLFSLVWYIKIPISQAYSYQNISLVSFVLFLKSFLNVK